MNNIRYTDDTVLFTDSVQDLQSLINKVNKYCSDEVWSYYE